ncbi:MAG: ATP-binding cassette domain-containing protein [Prolixibacteraceae bacterium]|nr:ATP-binding cassette domain-containing protein [Prolixibacteraceae bacterium]
MEDPLITIDIEKKMLTAHGKMNLSVKTNIHGGELLALFGNSGSGKTTLLRMLAGLSSPDRGVIKFNKTVWFDSASKIDVSPQSRNIGFMFQDYALFPNMTVAENLRFAQPQKDGKTTTELLSIFGLSEFANRKPNGLSGGQKQRVALARAFARKPNLLLLDEPLSALDFSMRVALQNEIAKAHQFLGATSIMVSHDLAEVFRLAHKVLKIESGQIAAYGTPEELFLNSTISGKVQITGSVVKIEKQDTFFLLTVITGMNQIIKVTAFSDDLENIREGDQVFVFTKAFNPIVMKL